ncbi:MAG: xylulokinase [Pantoea sp.]|uniref:xylulokinase n=1 Tax=Pantoea sp. TaxID=69393 RepID=UPI00290D3B22|nr:xylulokinase [Pantoea sp.]MDU6078514.1 xylulokinase [Pantoea sp.]MDU7839047.1 xylulokinase [Pantoea sp.]
MYIGIDLGTSGVKVALLNAQGEVAAIGSAPLQVSRPHALWSEQDPESWWLATDQAMQALAQQHALSEVKAIGLSGQMHGATLLDNAHRVLRPAILWNDGRSGEQCRELEQRVPASRQITGNLMMPGFTAPKLLWVRQHEPDIFQRVAKVLLPKDYLRWRLSGDFASDMSDAAGTMWLDVARRDWSDLMLDACGLTRDQMPRLFEGNVVTGSLSGEIAARWGMPAVPLVAGGGDNAAGAVGVGMTEPGQGMLSLGTSGVYFVVSDGYLSNPQRAVHSFCHALPQRWHLMSVILSSVACLDWAAALTGCADVPQLLAEAERADENGAPLWFLPYLSGERTPHNNPQATGVFFGLTHQHGRPELARAVLEGVGYALAQGMDAVHECGGAPSSIMLIGGGARSALWRQMLADISGQTLDYCQGGEVGPALGAARLAQLALEPQTTLPALTRVQRHQPDAARHQRYQPLRDTFARLYAQLAPLMR